MKKVLIVITDMEMGGAQKSLQAFLQCLFASEKGKKYNVHLMVVKPTGAFYSQLPAQIKLVQIPHELHWLGMHFSKKLFTDYFSIKGLIGEIGWLIKSRLGMFPKHFNTQQKLWECWRRLIPENREHYDIAVSYIDGFPNYYVMDKVSADKKVLWVHNEYQKQGYNPEYDRRFFQACDGIVTISEKCQQCIMKEFPDYSEKIHVLENITSYESVIKKSKEGSCSEYEKAKGIKILSVGRLSYIKGFDLAIEAAKVLKESGLEFLWLVVGDGPEREILQEMIEEYKLSDCFQLIGARDNPYTYMKECDIIVQPSRSEGKSIVLDEAKIMCKPIVVTNYTTVNDAIEHGKNGWIVDLTGESLAEGILQVQGDRALREGMIEFLNKSSKGNEHELEQYIKIMF